MTTVRFLKQNLFSILMLFTIFNGQVEAWVVPNSEKNPFHAPPPQSYPVLPHIEDEQTPKEPLPSPLQGSIETKRIISVPLTTKSIIKPKLGASSRIATIDAVIESEKETVDWYSWYLSCREYIDANHGFLCPIGVSVHIYKNGQFDTPFDDQVCILTVRSKFFPLPTNTQLDVLVLPIRRGTLGPASPEELRKRVPTFE